MLRLYSNIYPRERRSMLRLYNKKNKHIINIYETSNSIIITND